MGIFNNAKSITMNNKVVSSITTDTGVLYQKKVNSQLSIDVPLSLTYSDDFNITGYLTSNGVGVVGATVNLLVGSTVVDFTTTTTGGAYSFTNTPVSAGNHSFQVVFNGNSEYFASESSIVNRVVNKETSVLLNVTQTGKIGFASTGTGYNSVTPACILRTDDDEAIAFATIHFGDAIDSTQIDGYAQGNDVTYPTTSLNIVYDGDSNYTSSSVLASFEYQIPTLLNLTGTKNIISKDETTTISGILYDQDGDIIPNCQLEYNIKHNSTIITSGTVRTDNNGAITLNYTGTGIGDVDITVSYGNLLQETYELIDAIGILQGYTQNVSVSDNRYLKYTLPTVPSDYEVEFTAKSDHVNGNRWGIGTGTTEYLAISSAWGSSQLYCMVRQNNAEKTFGSETYSANMELHTIIRVQNGLATIICNDVVFCENKSVDSFGNTPTFIYFNTRTSGTHTVSDIIIKAL